MQLKQPRPTQLTAHREHEFVIVDNSGVRSRRPDETDTLGVGGQLAGTLSGDCVRGIEHRGGGDGPEHGDVLQRHLGRAVLTNANAGMGPHAVNVSLGRKNLIKQDIRFKTNTQRRTTLFLSHIHKVSKNH